MAFTEIDLELQSQDGTLNKEKLKADFLNGGDLNLTNGNENATITGLKPGVNPTDAVTKAQLDSVSLGGMTYRGQLDAGDVGTTLDNASRGDFYYISAPGTYLGLDFEIGDHLVVNVDITGSPSVGEVDKIDNTESADILRDSDIVDDLVTGGTTSVLSAQQGVVLKGLVDGNAANIATNTSNIATNTSNIATNTTNISNNTTNIANNAAAISANTANISTNTANIATNTANIATNTANIATNTSDITQLQNDLAQRVFGEKPAITIGSPTLAPLANFPVDSGTARVYINGLRGEEGAGNDYTINEATGVITLGFNAKAKTKVIVDYEY